ncbi:hypothetical protein JYU34_014734 [Plutella xylostella]|uniref:RNA-directed DNA polymerase n=1 Tax=Plutella xylostella TaxID=51655 RepID=A0ABQ7Q929_PLUXY|nr:hypothetical protein JYU34_014734 [Plutella xylostella]
MLREGVIEPVAASDWATPLVPVSKADGGLRICADYKITLNSALLVDRYPLPRFEDLLVTLNNSVIFSKCDLSQAYNQLVLDESSKQYTVINTHKGLFRYNRLVYGLSSSSGIFQRTMSNLLKGIPFVGIFIDDVIIGGRNITEHLQSLEMVMSRLCENGLKLKRNKCEFFVDEIKYLGYIICKDGVKTDPDKIKAMSEMAQPQNVTQLRSFLGLVNFYGRFVKNMSSIFPLYELLKKNVSWVWSDTCARAFNEVKRILSSSEVLAHYDESKPLILSCDASAQGVGGVLTQRGPRGERPVAYVSRTLNDAEKNYAQIHREALAIIFCLKKFHQYLYGRKFTLRTDHKPLVTIFGPKAGVPAMAASRLQRWAVIVSAYTYDIEYVNTKDNVADSFSRLPIKSRDSGYHRIPEQTYLHFVQDTSLIDSAHIKKETAKDHILGRVVSYIRDGWPKDVDMKNLKPYFNRKNELYLELGCVMWGHRVVIPESCQAKVLSELHEPHMGIVKTKCIARSYVWWPGVDEAVEAACRACAACAAASDAPRAHQPCPWPWCPRPWTRLHLDFMGPIDNKLYLVLVDATSKWLEVFQVPSTGAAHTIDRLNEVFGRFGLPKTLVSDNGPPFTSSQFSQFTQSNGIKHMFSAPYHPASNGAAENAVRTLKKVIKKAKSESVDIATALNKFLLHYRNTEHCTTGDSPAQLLMGHSLRTKLDVLKPDRENKIVHAQVKQSENKGGEKRVMRPGDPVWYRLYQKGDKWTAGEVSERLGATDYNIRNPDGTLTHRHVDQLRQRSRVSLAGPLPSCAPEQADSPAQSRAHDAGDSAGTSDLAPDNHQMSSESAAPPEPTEQPPPPPVSLPQSPSNAPRPPRVTRNLNPKYK